MSDDSPSLDELQRAVADEPANAAARRLLVEALLRNHEWSSAQSHIDILLETLPDEPWVLQLALVCSESSGDNLRAAYWRKRVKKRGDSELPWDPSLHPSRFSHVRVKEKPLLRLLKAADPVEVDAYEVNHAVERRLADVEGLATVKHRLSTVVDKACAAQLPGWFEDWMGGVLLYGPPACGKAYCVEAVAGELGASFWSFDMHQVWTAARLDELIAQAISEAADRYAVLYFSDIDSSSGDDSGELAKHLGASLDAVARVARVAVFASATYPWAAPRELVRPGRLSSALLVLPPDAPSRRRFLTNRFADHAPPESDDLEWVVSHTDGHSFGDLEKLVNASMLSAGTGRVNHKALAAARRSVLPSSAEWLTKAGHHALINPSGGIYEDLLTYFRTRQRH